MKLNFSAYVNIGHASKPLADGARPRTPLSTHLKCIVEWKDKGTKGKKGHGGEVKRCLGKESREKERKWKGKEPMVYISVTKS
jgi:hypothetical protein